MTVERLRGAGAIILGKTHLPEFGHKGTTDNRLGPHGERLVTATPWDLTRTAGGSSGGSAAAVAAGLAFLAMGTDIAGSVRIPASCCGVVGLKPSFGMIPRVPSGNAFSIWSSGPLARTAADAALAMSVLAGPDERDRFALPAGDPGAWDLGRVIPPLRIAWIASPTGAPVHPAVADGARAALDRLAGRDIQVVAPARTLLDAAEAGRLKAALIALFRVGALHEMAALTGFADRAGFDALADELSLTFRDFVLPAWDVQLPEYLHAQAALTSFVEDRAAAFFREFEDFDILATPTLAVPPFDKGLGLGPDAVNGRAIDPHVDWVFTWPFNLTGHPAVSVPCGWTDDAPPLPLGLQLVGRRGADGLVLRVAAAVEQQSPWASRRPLL